MKIAIAATAGKVSPHFGHCESFEIYRISGNILDMGESVATPAHDSCSLPDFLKRLGIDAVIIGGIGEKAIILLDAAGIDVYSGASGTTHAALASFIKGELKKGAEACVHEEGHGC